MKIFQIGFNRCGTLSLKKFFTSNGVKSVHWRTQDGKNVCLSAMENLNNNRKMFDGMDYTFYSDLEFVSSDKIVYLYENFKTMDEQYPDSKFILNTRDIDSWVNSRLNHQGPRLKSPYIDRCMNYYKCSQKEVVKVWKDHYHQHVKNVFEYFRDMSEKLLHFNLGESTGQDIVDFLPSIQFRHLDFPLTHVGGK
jgi:hypothetical protein